MDQKISILLDLLVIVRVKIALESIQNLLNYLQQSNNVSVSISVFSGMKDSQRQIRREQVNSLRQASLSARLFAM